VGNETKDLIVVKIALTPEVTLDKIQEHLSAHIKGQETQLTDEALSSSCDLARIRKVYKVPAPPAAKATNGVHQSKQDNSQLETQVLGAMALRGAT
jgi:EKC/KEOPS complex subunit CGI121/TPRKB